MAISPAQYVGSNPLGAYSLLGRADLLEIERQNATAISRLYKQTARELASRVASMPTDSLTKKALQLIENDLNAESVKLGLGLKARLAEDSARAAAAGSSGPLRMMLDLTNGSANLSPAAVSKIYASLNNLAVVAQWQRTLANGLTLSDRIWSTAATFRSDLKNLIDISISSGLGARDTAALIDKLAKQGGLQLKATLLKDYPKAAARLQMSGNLNWEALRLARTELSYAYNASAVMAGRMTPGYIGSRWMLSASHPDVDVCDEYANADNYGLGPGGYPSGSEPIFAHPNCLCYQVPIMEDREKFMQHLTEWERGVPWGDMDKWYQNVYLGQLERGAPDVAKMLSTTND